MHDILDAIKKSKNNSIADQMLLFDKFAPEMKHVCLRYVPYNYLAEELLIKGFMSAFQKMQSVKTEENAREWFKLKIIETCAESVFGAESPVYKQLPAAQKEEVKTKTGSSIEEVLAKADFAAKDLAKAANMLDPLRSFIFKLVVIDRFNTEDAANLLAIDPTDSKLALDEAMLMVKNTLYKICIKQI
jgi:DNA-directed RNA polymerase specialized sigma24 family protein